MLTKDDLSLRSARRGEHEASDESGASANQWLDLNGNGVRHDSRSSFSNVLGDPHGSSVGASPSVLTRFTISKVGLLIAFEDPGGNPALAMEYDDSAG